MEPISTCEIATRIFRKNVDGISHKIYIDKLLTDDDSTTRSNMKTVGKRKKDKGRLPPDVPPPSEYYTDPSHRVRVYGKPHFQLVGKYGMKPGHAERFKKYFTFAVHQYRHEPLAQFRNHVKASVEHVFNNHEYCDTSWCRYTNGTPQSNPDQIDEDIVHLTTVSCDTPTLGETDPDHESEIQITPRE